MLFRFDEREERAEDEECNAVGRRETKRSESVLPRSRINTVGHLENAKFDDSAPTMEQEENRDKEKGVVKREATKMRKEEGGLHFILTDFSICVLGFN